MVSSPGRRGSPQRRWVQVIAIVLVSAVVLSFVAGAVTAIF
jgi:hypothetical protein